MDSNILLEARGLSKSYETVAAVQNVSISLFRDESVGLVGESGCGKSTLSRMLIGLEAPDTGSVTLDGYPVGKRRVKDGRCLANVVFQNPLDSFDDKMTIGKSLAEALRFTSPCGKRESDAKIKEALEMVELNPDYANRFASQLSGGECQRAALARAILTRPMLFVCDEVTSALDVFVQAQLLDLLKRLRSKLQCTYLFISHDLSLVASTCSRVYVMYRGTIVEYGDVATIIEKPLHPHTKRLLSSAEFFEIPRKGEENTIPDIANISERDGAKRAGCCFASLCKMKSERCNFEAPAFRTIEGREVACHKQLVSTADA